MENRFLYVFAETFIQKQLEAFKSLLSEGFFTDSEKEFCKLPMNELL